MPIEARRNLTQIRLMDDVTMSGITQGDVMYHGASKWQNLAAGTAGNLLATGGSGANPSWASRLVYSSSGTLLAVNAGATTDVPFAVNGAASHTGDLAQFKVNGVSKGYISSAGVLQLGGTLVNDGLTISGAWPCTITARVSNGSYSVGDGTIRSGSGHALTLRGSLSSGAAVLIENIGSSGFGDTCRITAGAATSQVLQLRGTTSQTATLIQLQGTSTSTGGAAGTAQAEVDTAWVDSTHASRKARLLLRAYDTAVREGLRIDADGSYALTAIGGGTVTAGASLTVKSPTTTYVPLVVDSPASQSADLQQWKVNGTTKSSINSSGAFSAINGALGIINSAQTTTGIYFDSNFNGFRFVGGGTSLFALNGSSFTAISTSQFVWNASSIGTSPDTGLARSAVGVVTVTNGSTGSGSLLLTAASAATTPCTIKGASAQSANLTEWQNSSAVVLAQVSKDGYVKSVNTTGSQYVELCSAASLYPGIRFYHDSLSHYLAVGYAELMYIANGSTVFSAGMFTYSLLSNDLRFGSDTTTTVHNIYRRTTNRNASKGYGLKMYADDGPTGATNSDGGDLCFYGGALRGTGVNGNVNLGYTGSAARGNVSLFSLGSYGGGNNVVFIANATTVPTTDPTGGGILYCEGGALKYRGSSGTVTTLGAA